MRTDLETRRRAIAQAFRDAMVPRELPPTVDVAALQQSVTSLSRKVEKLAGELDYLRASTSPSRLDRVPILPTVVDEEPPAGRAVVPPITPAKISNKAFEVLLGA